MKLDVTSSGYKNAADAFLGANYSVADGYTTLKGVLSGMHGMGGDDATSEDFVANYDPAAKELSFAVADIVAAFATMADLTDASGKNHHDANQESCIHLRRTDYVPCEGEPDKVESYSPPSALGGSADDTPGLWDEIVGHLEGWTWPSADTGRLKQAGNAWRAMATVLDGIDSYTSSADSHLKAQTSPEIYKARAALSELEGSVTTLAEECRSLGDSCDEYATQVESTKEVVRDICKDLAIELGATAVVGIVGSFFTFGGAGAASAAFATWRIARFVRRIIAAFKALRAIKAVTRIATSAARATKVRTVLTKFRSARALRNKPTGKLPPKGRPNSYGYDKFGNRLPYANNRPSLPKKVVNTVWNRALKEGGGKVYVRNRAGDWVEVVWKPGMKRKDVWDMGHIKGKEYRTLRDQYLSGKISKEEFLKRFRDPDNYRVENPGRNRSHVDE